MPNKNPKHKSKKKKFRRNYLKVPFNIVDKIVWGLGGNKKK